MPVRLFPKNSNWDWGLLLSIFLYQAIPAIYNAYSIYLIGNADPSENTLAIASQWQIIQVMLEVVQESIVFPVYFFVGGKVRDSELLMVRVASCLKVMAVVLIPIALVIYFQADNLVQLIGTPTDVSEQSIYYLRIRIWSIIFGIANVGLIVIAESLNMKSTIIKVLVLKTLVFIFFDSLFYGGYSFSLGLGINGLALSNVLVEIIMFLFVIIHVEYSLGKRLFRNLLNFRFSDLKIYSQLSLGLLVDSLVRNVAYLVLIVSLMNSLGGDQIGGYYLSMQLFWSFLLVPIIAVSETLRVKIGNSSKNIDEVKSLLFYAVRVALLLIIGWGVIVPFSENIFNYLNSDKVVSGFALKSFRLLIIPYGFLSLNIVLDSVFYGMGRTKYLAYQSLLTNFTVYLTGYLAYVSGYWTPTFTSILVLFSLGIIVDSILTVFFLKKLLIR